MERAKILLLGDNFRSAVAVSETLSKSGFEVHVLGWWGIPLEKSRWIEKYHYIRRWDLHLEGGKDAFERILQENSFKTLIPVNDDALEIGALFEELILKYTTMTGFPTREKWIFAKDKSALLRQFETLGLGGPQSVLLASAAEIQAKNIPFDFPYIVKPCSSRQLNGDQLNTASVQKISDAATWKNWQESQPAFPVMVQEFIGGRELGFNFYAENGKIIHSYIDEQLHGRIGNEASYRRIAPLTAEQESQIVSVFKTFVQAISWDGVGMFDFKYDRDKVFIIEFNGRFWASIQLSKFTGSDLAQLFTDRKLLQKPMDQIVLQPSRKGSLRNLKSDLAFALGLLKRKELGAFFRWIYSLKNMLLPSEHIEDSLFRDINFRFNILKWHFVNFVRR